MKNINKINNSSNKSNTIILLLFIFFCYLGLHRFYVGKIKEGVYLLLLEVLGIFFISLKLLLIAKYYINNNYGSFGYYFNFIGLIGYICFIIVILSLFKDITNILANQYGTEQKNNQ
ncbi:NINE protein [Rickettsiales bacterium LUAb2]